VPGAPDRDAVLQHALPELAHARVDHGVDGAGGHDVDPDTVSDELDGGGARQRVEPALGGDVGREERRRRDTQGGADVNDAPAAALAHRPRHELGQHEGTDQVDPQHLREVGGRDLGQRRLQAHRRRVDHHVHAAPLGPGRRHQPRHVGLDAHVARDRQRASVGAADRAHDVTQTLRTAPEDGHARALPREALGGGPADTGAAAGHERDLAVKRAH
jgi:hypothetical protein